MIYPSLGWRKREKPSRGKRKRIEYTYRDRKTGLRFALIRRWCGWPDYGTRRIDLPIQYEKEREKQVVCIPNWKIFRGLALFCANDFYPKSVDPCRFARLRMRDCLRFLV